MKVAEKVEKKVVLRAPQKVRRALAMVLSWALLAWLWGQVREGNDNHLVRLNQSMKLFDRLGIVWSIHFRYNTRQSDI